MQRLLAQAISSQQQAAIALVKHRKSEHSPQLVYAIATKILIEMNNNLGIAVGVEDVAVFFQLAAKLTEIVNLAVKHYPDRAVLVEHRLMATSQVNDAKSAHTESRALLDKQAFIVGPAVNHGLAHFSLSRWHCSCRKRRVAA